MLQILLPIHVSKLRNLKKDILTIVFKDSISMSMLVKHHNKHKEAKAYMMMLRDYDWMMVLNEAQRSHYKSKSKARASQVMMDYELKTKDNHSMLGL